MQLAAFDRKKHVYSNAAFGELVKDAIRFFNGTPIHMLPPVESFVGAGVYAIYYTGTNPLYKKYAQLNRLCYGYPIYVGKAVPKGWRQGRQLAASNELYARLNEHSRSITAGAELLCQDFWCRFIICENEDSYMISIIEATLIKLNKPLWNIAVDGFGNNDPGKGRYQQAMSDWDVIHKGRAWAEKCQGQPKDKSTILTNIATHLQEIG